jgi:heat shock protein HslJ
MRTRRVATAAAAALLAAGLTACGDAGDAGTSETTQTTPATEAATVTDTPPETTPPETPPAAPAGFTGTWVDPDGKGYLTFDGQGGITGSDACNGISTTYTVDGTTATVEPFPTTMMACGEGWSQWLLGVTTVELHDGALGVLGRDGEELGTLVPGEAPGTASE